MRYLGYCQYKLGDDSVAEGLAFETETVETEVHPIDGSEPFIVEDKVKIPSEEFDKFIS